MKKIVFSLTFAILLLGLIVYNSYTLECYFFIHVSDRYYEKVFNDYSYARFGYDIILDQKIINQTLDVPTFNVSFRINSLGKIQVLEGKYVTPERIDFDFEVGYSFGDLFLAFGYAVYNSIAKFDNELLLKANYYISPLDVVLILPEIEACYDFGGFYGSLGAKANVTLPTNPLINLGFGAIGNMYTDGYYSLNGNGFGILFPLILSVYFDEISISLEGGYFLSLSGAVQSYPYINLRLGIEFSSE